MKVNKAVVFDLDGTLVDSAPTIMYVANSILATHSGLILDLKTTSSFIGNGSLVLMEKILAYHRLKGHEIAIRAIELVEEFDQLYALNPVINLELYPNVKTSLNQFKSAGFKIGLCTNKRVEVTQIILDYFDLSPYFDIVIGADQVKKHKPDPEGLNMCVSMLAAQKTFYVGDSEVDSSTAKNAGLPFIYILKDI